MRVSEPYDFDVNDIDYDPITEKYHLSFDPEQVQAPAMIIVQLVSYITETSPLSLPQLHSSIDTDSLNSWLSATEEPRRDLEISFTYAEHQITLDGRGELWVQPVDATTALDENGSD